MYINNYNKNRANENLLGFCVIRQRILLQVRHTDSDKPAGEAPALGVAILAMVGTGIYSSVPEACEKILKIKTTISPVAENTEKYKKVYAVYKSLYPHLKADYESLAML